MLVGYARINEKREKLQSVLHIHMYKLICLVKWYICTYILFPLKQLVDHHLFFLHKILEIDVSKKIYIWFLTAYNIFRHGWLFFFFQFIRFFFPGEHIVRGCKMYIFIYIFFIKGLAATHIYIFHTLFTKSYQKCISCSVLTKIKYIFTFCPP